MLRHQALISSRLHAVQRSQSSDAQENQIGLPMGKRPSGYWINYLDRSSMLDIYRRYSSRLLVGTRLRGGITASGRVSGVWGTRWLARRALRHCFGCLRSGVPALLSLSIFLNCQKIKKAWIREKDRRIFLSSRFVLIFSTISQPAKWRFPPTVQPRELLRSIAEHQQPGDFWRDQLGTDSR